MVEEDREEQFALLMLQYDSTHLSSLKKYLIEYYNAGVSMKSIELFADWYTYSSTTPSRRKGPEPDFPAKAYDEINQSLSLTKWITYPSAVFKSKNAYEEPRLEL